MKHTPAPWKVVNFGEGPIIQSKNRYIASLTTYGTVKIKDNWDIANANLISAAPELLEACEETLSALKRCVQNDIALFETIGLDEQVNLLREAIAKAVGTK